MWTSWKQRKYLWAVRGDWSFDFASVMLSTGEPKRALLWARAGWLYAHHLPLLGDVCYWLAREGMRARHWADVGIMVEHQRIDRRKGMALVGMSE